MWREFPKMPYYASSPTRRSWRACESRSWTWIDPSSSGRGAQPAETGRAAASLLRHLPPPAATCLLRTFCLGCPQVGLIASLRNEHQHKIVEQVGLFAGRLCGGVTAGLLHMVHMLRHVVHMHVQADRTRCRHVAVQLTGFLPYKALNFCPGNACIACKIRRPPRPPVHLSPVSGADRAGLHGAPRCVLCRRRVWRRRGHHDQGSLGPVQGGDAAAERGQHGVRVGPRQGGVAGGEARVWGGAREGRGPAG